MHVPGQRVATSSLPKSKLVLVTARVTTDTLCSLLLCCRAYASVRSKAWLAARVSLRLARLPRTASSVQRSRRLRSMCAVSPVLLAHAELTKIIIFSSMGPKLRYLGGSFVAPNLRIQRRKRVNA